jgi:hypothetical protein
VAGDSGRRRPDSASAIAPPKKPKIKRMRRPQDAFSYNPDDTLDSNVMRRFNLSEKDFNEMSEESKKGFREGFKLLQGEK